MKTYMSNPSFYLFLFFLIAIQQIQSQVIEPTTNKSSQELYDFYTLKQKKNKTAAWIMLGGGLVITMAGLVVNSEDEVGNILTLGFIEFEKEHKGDWMIYLGSATTLASVPFFIAAGKNKRKARLSLKGESMTFSNLSYKKSKHLSLALTIDF